MSFNRLPLELKQVIWQLALHAAVDEPEICITWPLKTCYHDKISQPLLVDTAFPVLMHVCGEWRDFAFLFCQRPAFPIKFRFSRLADCPVPYRPFRASTDILYVSAMNYEQAILCQAFPPLPGIPTSTLATVRHLAVDWPLWLNPGRWLPELVYRGCPDLEKISIVFPSSRQAIWSAFRAPATRCKLRRVEGADTLSAEKIWKSKGMEVVSIQMEVDSGVEWLEWDTEYMWNSEVSLHKYELDDSSTDWFVGSAFDKERRKFCLVYEPAAFVKYRRSEDGGAETWVEACEDRLLDLPKCFRKPDSRCMDPEYSALDPEVVRVNDEDDYHFHCVYGEPEDE